MKLFRLRPLSPALLAAFVISSASVATAAPAARPDAIDTTVAEFFRPYELDLATLSPDGARVALAQQASDGRVGILIVDVDTRTSRPYHLADSPTQAVQQLLWLSPTRLAFTTRSRALGTLDVESGKITPLLFGRDFDSYQPEPQLGPRTRSIGQTPDQPADPTAASPLDPFELNRQVSVQELLTQAQISGDLFGSESTRDTGRSLSPYLLGIKPDKPTLLLVEVRSDSDRLRRDDETSVTVPSNVTVYDRREAGGIPPDSESRLQPAIPEYGTYRVSYLPPPLVLLEVDTVKGRTREIAREDTWRRMMLDQQGQLRLSLEQRGSSFRYLHRAADSKTWVPLDSLVKHPTPLGFAFKADALLAPRSVPLGFDANGKALYLATNLDSDTFLLRALDVTTGQLDPLEIGHKYLDLIEPTTLMGGDVLRFDRYSHALAGVRYATRRQTRWFDQGMTALQNALNQKFQPLRTDLREWNRDRTRYLAEVSAPDDPGRFVVVDPATGKLVSCGDRAPWLAAERRNPTTEFNLRTADGRRLAGFLTLPRKPRIDPPPVLVYYHDGPWFSDTPVFNRGAQALAALGFAVLQLNHRGSSGLGRKHLTGIEGGLDRVVLEDTKAFLSHIGGVGKQAINTHQVATFGNGIGGYLAVRMVQLAPETFRCAVAINAPGDLDAWRSNPEPLSTLLAEQRKHFFGKDREALRAQSAVAAGATTKVPVLVVHGSGNTYVPFSMGRELYRAVKNSAPETAFLELPHTGHGAWSRQTTARLFAELGRFFNATIYNYGVKIQKSQVVPDTPGAP